ncbi:MAG: hypothetical protein ACREE6_04820 [Limisphaerales bacterium]
MLKRDGKFIERQSVPGTSQRLTDTELAAYNAAFATIERDYRQIEDIKGQLERLDQLPLEKADSKSLETVTANGKNWNAHAALVNLPKSEILLCHDPKADQWAVVQRHNTAGRYAQAHGEASVLLTGNSAREVVDEYSSQANHTLRFMARNLTAQAQGVVWEKYPDNNPSQVMHAISERCALAVDNSQTLERREDLDRSIKQSRGMSI